MYPLSCTGVKRWSIWPREKGVLKRERESEFRLRLFCVFLSYGETLDSRFCFTTWSLFAFYRIQMSVSNSPTFDLVIIDGFLQIILTDIILVTASYIKYAYANSNYGSWLQMVALANLNINWLIPGLTIETANIFVNQTMPFMFGTVSLDTAKREFLTLNNLLYWLNMESYLNKCQALKFHS